MPTFSDAGCNHGEDDNRGTVIKAILKYLHRAKPVAFMLENVRGLVIRHTQFFEWILKSLREMACTR